MRCRKPRTVGFLSDGKTISWSQKRYSREYPSFQLPCGKCIECRLEYARTWAVRCVHEAKVHKENSFITLTYSDEHLTSPRLVYSDFQKFMKRLRFAYPNRQIGCFVTGEYGDLRKRPHWHALLFNWYPPGAVYKYSTERGDKVYSAASLEKLWPFGVSEVGSVTFESAGYVARYAAKKLVHGEDQDHDFQPISRKSSKNAIGKRFLELYWRDLFSHGRVVIDGREVGSIPRYYEKWLQKNHFEEWLRYTERVKSERQRKAELTSKQVEAEYYRDLQQRLNDFGLNAGNPISQREQKAKILDANFKQLQSYLKGDI